MTNFLRRFAALAVAPALASVAFAATPAVTAQATCVVTVSHPNISIHAEDQYQRYHLTNSCGAAEWSWDMVAADGSRQWSLIPGFMSYTYSYVSKSQLGKWHLYGSGAYDDNWNALPQADATFYVKVATGARIYGYWSGNWVYLHAKAIEYSQFANYWSGGWIASKWRYVSFWSYSNGSWHYRTTTETRSTGWTPYVKIWSPAHHYFKAHVVPTYRKWGRWSSSIWR